MYRYLLFPKTFVLVSSLGKYLKCRFCDAIIQLHHRFYELHTCTCSLWLHIHMYMYTYHYLKAHACTMYMYVWLCIMYLQLMQRIIHSCVRIFAFNKITFNYKKRFCICVHVCCTACNPVQCTCMLKKRKCTCTCCSYMYTDHLYTTCTFTSSEIHVYKDIIWHSTSAQNVVFTLHDKVHPVWNSVI